MPGLWLTEVSYCMRVLKNKSDFVRACKYHDREVTDMDEPMAYPCCMQVIDAPSAKNPFDVTKIAVYFYATDASKLAKVLKK